MGLTRPLLRCPWVALVALVVAPLMLGGTSATAGTLRDCAGQMDRNGCCCPAPSVGNCCSGPAASTGPSDASAGVVWAVGQVAPRTASVDWARTGATCQCRSNEPVAPNPQPDRRGADSHGDQEPVAINGEVVRGDGAHDAVNHLSTPTASLPKSPLYLRTTHLLI
jgi:hypothetical protein